MILEYRVRVTYLNSLEEPPMTNEMIGFASQRLMELEVQARTGAGYGQKDPARSGSHNVTATANATGSRRACLH